MELLGLNVRGSATEFDLSARDGDEIVFIEVKTRRSARWGHPYEAVDAAKRDRMERGALEFMDQVVSAEMNYRFVIASILIVDDGSPRLAWIEAA